LFSPSFSPGAVALVLLLPPFSSLVSLNYSKLLAHHLELDTQELIYQAGRITAEDAKVVGELAKTYQKQLPVLLRLIRDNPELNRKFFGKQHTPKVN
jgi:hypothetical protein